MGVVLEQLRITDSGVLGRASDFTSLKLIFPHGELGMMMVPPPWGHRGLHDVPEVVGPEAGVQ